MKYINLDQLDRICRGDKNKRMKYLEQYLELIPRGVTRLENALKPIDRKALSKEIHHLQAQLVFFGMKDISLVKIEDENNENLILRMNKILVDIKNSILEIETIAHNIEVN